ncbi:endonuclease MutS2 [Eubacterium sp. BX4]|uniref:Endonuclease MutS2 n=2 Tax=Eubacterium TaxID=1730 RepID=A0ABR7F286_9FIRM|nr:endonuclease MutS2 [Eubacterium segne]MBC5667701.1 endonuclease MutS2 [Eubacterium segne]
MNEKVLKTLEYNKIINMLKDEAGSDLGRMLCSELKPSNDLNEIKKNQLETDDALKRIWQKGSVSFSGIKDIGESLKRLEIGSTLGVGELLSISSLLKVALRVKTFSRNEDAERDSLDDLFESIEPLTNLNKEIEKCIISEDEIADDASFNLKNIRRQVKITNDRIHSQLSSLVNSQNGKTYLQESLITMRDGRYCVPVKQEYRGNVTGIIHDQSSSGSTLFVEPTAVVELNNKLRELSVKEAEEIQIILANLSISCAEYIDQLRSDLKLLPYLDFVFAKANLAKKMKASMPEFNSNRFINIKQGRHPLLDGKKVVPIDVNLGKDFTLLIITGPNTGGKTVSLKTVGLLSLMGQAGLHIPALPGSQLGVFNEIFADIGDEQSIEQSLSTFSAHMVNTVNILEKADSDSLVLFDELGAGTDPVEGAALGISILSFLKNMGVRTMATTHYSELKLFALSTEGVQNASCEFDVETLRPTYRLLIGIPGKSNAFAISQKLGLPQYIIDDAKSRIDADNEQFEDVLAELEQKKRQIEKDKETISVYKSQIASLKRDYEIKNKTLDEKKDKILSKARDEALDILKEAKETADEAIKTINKYGKSGNMKELEKSRSSVGSKIKKNQSSASMKSSKQKKTYKPSDFKIGTGVKVLSMNLNGSVVTLPNADGNLTVKMGILNSKVNIKDLEIIDEPDIKAPGLNRTGSGKIKMNKSLNVKMELNLIGKTVDEALFELDKYLDDAYLAHLPQVYIIHGKGTGTLRNAIQTHLKKCPYVKSYRNGEHGEGGAGATVVEFK